MRGARVLRQHARQPHFPRKRRTLGLRASILAIRLEWEFLLYVGIGLVVRSPWILLLTLPLAITIRFGVIAREEAYLERGFGTAYRDYKARVRRWL